MGAPGGTPTLGRDWLLLKERNEESLPNIPLTTSVPGWVRSRYPPDNSPHALQRFWGCGLSSGRMAMVGLVRTKLSTLCEHWAPLVLWRGIGQGSHL